MSAAFDPEIARRRQRIRQAGRRLGQARIAAWMLLMLLPISFAVPALVRRVDLQPSNAWTYLGWELQVLGYAAVVVLWLAALLVAICRWLRRRALRRQLSALSPVQQAELLLPLRAERAGDTRQLVEPLIRQLGVHASEVAPAASPAGRGTGAAPTEDGNDGREAQEPRSRRIGPSSSRSAGRLLACAAMRALRAAVIIAPLYVLVAVPLLPLSETFLLGIPGTGWCVYTFHAGSSQSPGSYWIRGVRYPPHGFARWQQDHYHMIGHERYTHFTLRLGKGVWGVARMESLWW